jgi:hypothetical protein
MDEATLDAALSRVAVLGEWSSENILVSVYDSLDSENMMEIDLCQTLRGPHRHQMSRVKNCIKKTDGSFPFEVCLNFGYPALPHFLTSECFEFSTLNF